MIYINCCLIISEHQTAQKQWHTIIMERCNGSMTSWQQLWQQAVLQSWSRNIRDNSRYRYVSATTKARSHGQQQHEDHHLENCYLLKLYPSLLSHTLYTSSFTFFHATCNFLVRIPAPGSHHTHPNAFWSISIQGTQTHLIKSLLSGLSFNYSSLQIHLFFPTGES
jgi:hypothetical protein